MEFNGDMYACDHYVFPEYKIGNIKTHTIYKCFFSEKQRRFGVDKRDLLPTQCRQCEFFKSLQRRMFKKQDYQKHQPSNRG
jgi:uncharacterized protein